MNGFLATFRFELRYYAGRISTWVYFAIFFAIAFLMMNAIGGAWDSVGMSVGGSGGNVHVNSPYVLAVLVSAIGMFAVILVAAIAGHSAHRDYSHGIDPLFFTTPVSRFDYLGGRFAGAVLTMGVIFLAIPVGLFVAAQMPWLDAARFGPDRMAAYLQPYLVVVVPNLVFSGALFFALAAITRSMLPNYVGGAAMLVGYMLAGNLLADMENRTAAALVDPFGMSAIEVFTKYWTVAEKNALLLPLEGVLLWNRLLWVGAAGLVFAAVLARFRFAHGAGGRRRRGEATGAEPEGAVSAADPSALPAVDQTFGIGTQLRQFATIAKTSFLGVVRNVYFLAIVAAGLLFLLFSADQVGKLYGTTTWPVTYAVLDVLSGTFALFVLIIVAFYAGELVWRERDLAAHQIHDALPLPNWIPFAAKLTALAGVVVVLQAVLLVAGILTQAFKGYYTFELDLYVTALFGLQLADYLLLCVLAMTVHVLANHKYMGHLIIVLYFVSTLFMSQFGLEHNLYRYGSDAGTMYSDMNGYGPFLVPFAWFKLYWAAVALLLAVASNLFWVRGEEAGLRARIRRARLRFGRPAALATAVAVTLIVGLGGFVFYNTNVLNEYRTSHDNELASVEYERRYKAYEDAPQPKITTVDVQADIFPAERDVRIRGTYRLVNKTDAAIDSVHLLVARRIDIQELGVDRPAREVLADREIGYHILDLDEPLAPGDSLNLRFDLLSDTRGFQNRVGNTSVVENGTFFNSSMLPAVGYDPRGELSDDETRRKYDLDPKPRMPRIDDPEGLRRNFISRDADWIDFSATVSTSPDQIAIAPGYRVREWTEDGRRYFRYEMDAPILNFYSFLSARYEVARDEWNGVAIEVYHHPGHEYNVDRMIDAVKKSLAYFTENFGPYQHRQVRILEFPRYATFAQSFPNTIPYSEAIGFIARMDDEDDIDYPFYVTAHEVAHQWFGHQLVPAGVQGSSMLSETFSQYGAMMVMEEEYGEDQIHRFLEYELDRYLTGRTMERKKELPLYTVENQGYIHYRKGAVVMYALKDYLGEDRLNEAIRRYLADVRFQEPPYTNTVEFLEYLEAEAPDSLQPLIDDLFRRITLFDVRAESATAEAGDGGYVVELDIEAKKLYADSLGNESEVPIDEWIDVGVFAAGDGDELGRPLYLRKHRITPETDRIRVTVAEKPARAGIDPYHKRIDRHTDDNVVKVRVP